MSTTFTSDVINRIVAEFSLVEQASLEATVAVITAGVTTGQFQPITDLFDEGFIVDSGPFFAYFKTLTDDATVAEQAALSVFKAFEDASTVSDQVSKGPGKGLFDTPQLAEEINTIGFGKNPSDVINFEHTEVFEIAKQLADALAITDDIVLTIILTHAIADAFNATDSALLASIKAASDTTSAAEILTRAIGKFLEDSPAALDAEVRAVQKALADAAVLSDAPSKGLEKSFSDAVNSVDVIVTNVTNLFRQLSDTVVATDDVDGTASLQDDQELQFVKNITNIAGATEAIQLVVGFVRQLADTASATDSPARSVGKHVSDSYQTLESHSLAAGKVLTDVGLLADVDTLDIGKAIADSSAATDAEARGLGKLLTNTSLATDSFSQGLAKILSDTVDFGDSLVFDQVTLREFADTVDATDDVDGTASIQDDQEIAFIKFVNNTTSVVDLLVRVVAYTRGVSEQPVASDSHAAQTSKPVDETPTVSDLFLKTLQFNRAFFEQTLLTEAEIVAFGKTLEDVSSVSESLVKQVAFARSPEDTSSASDDDTIDFGKPIADTTTFSEVISFGELLTKTDSALLSDAPVLAFGGGQSDTTGVSESLEFVFGLNQSLANSARALESLLLGYEKALSDTTSIADAGSLISQGYCDISYFADDYVGTARTF
mgnify:CR=1 FL=1